MSSKEKTLGKLQSIEVQINQEERAKELEATVAHLRAELKEKSGIIAQFQKSRGGQIELARLISESVKALPSYQPLQWAPRDPSKSEVALVENLSDLHVGELIRPAETRGMGAFNWAIAQKRLNTIHLDNLLNYLHVNRLGYNIPDLHIFGIGDYVSGDIHQELLVTNEFPLPGQVARAALLIAEHIRGLGPYFRSITLHGVGADNHGRLVKKPQAKQKSANNMSFLVHALVEAHVRDLPNVKVIQYEDMAPIIEVANHRFIVTHGDNIKSVMGIPYYGFERYLAKEAIRSMKKEGFDYVNIGHWHMPRQMEPFIINGSLSGTTEFDHASGRFSKPSQVSYLVHRKHGVFNFTGWKFEIESEETDARRK